MERWTAGSAAQLYKIDKWGSGFFSVNQKGNVEIDPHKDGRRIDLKELVDDIGRQGLDLPVLIRFSNILEKRIEEIHTCFDSACRTHGYRGRYYGVYPIKVNQQRQVVEEVVRFGRVYNLGLEAGSKPELHAVLAMMDNPDGLIVCNGYKDEDYVRMALIGQKLDRKVVIVVEKLAELSMIIRIAQDLGIHPCIGLRIKLSSSGSGRWEESGGEQSKFGLTAAEIVRAVEIASSQGMLDSLKLLHFHLGSQITDISSIQESLKELSRFYIELTKAGCEIEYIDVGGGLGIDYDGSNSNGPSSVNYSMQDYAESIVSALGSLFDANGAPHPNIVTESGRALAAHHSVMVMDVLEATRPPLWTGMPAIDDGDDERLLGLRRILLSLNAENVRQGWQEANVLKREVLERFKQGSVSLNARASMERLYWTIAREAYRLMALWGDDSRRLVGLQEQLCYKYFCNFSVFQSLPDSWAIDQVFPVMPVHRLLERPSKEATLQDITCDSDGRVDRFIGSAGSSPVLAVHDVLPGEPYLLGAFLVGAYQEILGDLHNLFGDTNTVHVSLDDAGRWRFEQIFHGEDVKDVLEYVQFDAADLLERVSRMLGYSLGKGKIEPAEVEEMMKLYREGLQGYTYLIGNHNHVPPPT